jgi:hypothetical protein
MHIISLIGGVAGGSKYFHGSIFFKFPTDEMNLYGGEEGNKIPRIIYIYSY